MSKTSRSPAGSRLVVFIDRSKKMFYRKGRFVPLVMVLAFVAVATSCDAPRLAGPSDSALRAQLGRMGFRTDMIKDEGDHFLVEGDIVIYKSDLGIGGIARIQPKWKNQYYSNNLVSSTNVASIVVDLSNTSSDWQDAARAAMSEWNSITTGSTIYMTEGSPGDITLSDTTFGSSCSASWVARADFPRSNDVGPSIKVNRNFDCLSASMKKLTIAHELGHTIGFRHSDWYPNGESSCPTNPSEACGANLVPGTGTDNSSVMHHQLSAYGWQGFTTYDKVAAVYLYGGVPTLSISYPDGVTTLSWTSVSGASSYRVRLWEYSVYHTQEVGEWSYSGYEEVANTASTSTTHSNWPYTGYVWCHYTNESIPEDWTKGYSYSVEAVFPTGYSRPSSPVDGQVAKDTNGSQPADSCG